MQPVGGAEAAAVVVQAQEAIRKLQSGTTKGKVVLYLDD